MTPDPGAVARTVPPPAVARRSRARYAIAAAAIVVGLALLARAGYLALRDFAAPAPYRYVAGATVAAADLGPLAPLAGRGVAVQSGHVVAADGTTLADFDYATAAGGPVLLDWRPKIDAPFLSLPAPADEIAELAPVLDRHVAGEPVLAWWDSSRQLALLGDAAFPLGDALGVPLFVPARWRADAAQVESIEAAFWKTDPASAARQRFDRFTAALLADEQRGIAELRALAGGRTAILVLHARDMLLLGQLAPDRLGVAFRDFDNGGDVHGMVPAVYAWLKERQYPSYTVVRADGGRKVRAVALTDAASGRTLGARLLPFIGNEQGSVRGTVLVFRTGGFWVYRIEPTDDAAAASTPSGSGTLR